MFEFLFLFCWHGPCLLAIKRSRAYLSLHACQKIAKVKQDYIKNVPIIFLHPKKIRDFMY
jgi:hypothetical protein